MNSKKGMKTIVTIFALIFIVFVFIVFYWLFKISGEKSTGKIESQFTSLTADTVLKIFLKTPAYDLEGNIPLDMTPDVESRNPTNANLFAWTCSNNNDQNFRALKASVNNFFNNVYGNAWELDVLYSSSDINRKVFGRGNFLPVKAEDTNSLWYTGQRVNVVAARSTFFVFSQRQPGYAFQVLPCLDGSLAMVRIKGEKVEIKELT